MAIEKGYSPVSLGIDYHQHHRVELDYAEKLSRRFKVERRVLRIEWDKPHREIPLDRSIEEMRAKPSPAFLPGRNIVFLTLGLAEAAGIGASEVWIGINSIDFSGYPDCTQEFLDSYSKTIQVGMPGGPRILAPLMFLSKPEIAKKAANYGLQPDDTWSCYRPVLIGSLSKPCGRCDACRLNEYAWKSIQQEPLKTTS